MPTLPFNVIQQLDLPLTEIVSGRIGYVHDAFLPFSYDIRETLPEDGRDLVVLMGKKRRSEGIRELGEYPGRVVIVFAAGDAGMRTAYLKGSPGLPPNVVAAFGVNNELADRRAISVPLGVRVSKLLPLQFVRQNGRRPRDRLLYANFALSDDYYRPERRTNAPHIRQQLVDRFRGVPWVNLDISEQHRNDFADLIDYYSEITAHKFVLSPEGNGIDCYRTWEALYLGAIPIVMVSTVTTPFTNLPILFTNDYRELTEEYLEQRWREMSSRSFEIDRMLKSWYLRRFLDAVSTLDNPRFLCWKMEDFPSDRFVDVLHSSSRSASSIMAETPVPPFIDGDDLTTPEAWSAPGALRLERVDGQLRATIDGSGNAVAEVRMRTIPGGRFRLTGQVRPGNEIGEAPPLTFQAEARPEVLATGEAGATQAELRLDFVARSNWTVVVMRGPKDASGVSWLLDDLSLQATV